MNRRRADKDHTRRPAAQPARAQNRPPENPVRREAGNRAARGPGPAGAAPQRSGRPVLESVGESGERRTAPAAASAARRAGRARAAPHKTASTRLPRGGAAAPASRSHRRGAGRRGTRSRARRRHTRWPASFARPRRAGILAVDFGGRRVVARAGGLRRQEGGAERGAVAARGLIRAGHAGRRNRRLRKDQCEDDSNHGGTRGATGRLLQGPLVSDRRTVGGRREWPFENRRLTQPAQRLVHGRVLSSARAARQRPCSCETRAVGGRARRLRLAYRFRGY